MCKTYTVGVRRLRVWYPVGMTDTQPKIPDPTFRGDQPNPCVCEIDPSRRHILFHC